MSYNNYLKKTSDPLAADMALLSKPASQLSKAEQKKQNELRIFYGLNANNQVCSRTAASRGNTAMKYPLNNHAASRSNSGMKYPMNNQADSSDEDDDDYDVECDEEEEESDSGEEQEEDSDDGDDGDEVDTSAYDTDAPEEHVSDGKEFSLAALRAAKNRRR